MVESSMDGVTEVISPSVAEFTSNETTIPSNWIAPPQSQPDTNTPLPIQVKTTQISAQTVLSIPPMIPRTNGWDEEHFHPTLKSQTRQGLILTFSASGKQCVAISISPQPRYVLGKTYAVHLGALNNSKTVLRRHLPNGVNVIETEVLTPQIVSQVSATTTKDAFKKYWIMLRKGVLSVGLGSIPGKSILGTLDDSLYDQLRSGMDAAIYIGLGNSALERSSKYNRGGNSLSDVKFANVMLYDFPTTQMGKNAIQFHHELYEDEQKALYDEFKTECEKAKKRAAKFGIEYVEPNIERFLQRRRNDLELLKLAQEGAEMEEDKQDDAAVHSEKQQMEQQMLSALKVEHSKRKYQEEEEMQAELEPLVVLEVKAMEAFDKIGGRSGKYRVDPPKSMLGDNTALTVSVASADDADKTEHPEQDELGYDDKPVLEPEKIHLYTIDHAAFLQIRTDDIMEYLSDFEPSYVEWLSDFSCNILFEDSLSAARALAGLSQAIPSTPTAPSIKTPIFQEDNDQDKITKTDDGFLKDAEGDADLEEKDASNNGDQGDFPSAESTNQIVRRNKSRDLPDLASMGWRFCKRPIVKTINDKYGRRGTTARHLMRVATTFDVYIGNDESKPPTPHGFTTKHILGPNSDHVQQVNTRRRKNNKAEERWDHDLYSGSDGMDNRKAKKIKRNKKNKKTVPRKRNSKANRMEFRVNCDEYLDDDDYGDDSMEYEDNISETNQGKEVPVSRFQMIDRALKSARPGGFTVEQLQAERLAADEKKS